MKNTVTTEALVLSGTPYRDFDVVLSLFGPDLGNTTAMAYSARRSRTRFPSGLDRMTRCEFVLEEWRPDRWTVRSAVVLDDFWTIRSSLEAVTVGSLLCEILARVHTEPHEARGLYEFAMEVLRLLEACPTEPPGGLAASVVWGSLTRLGFLPQHICCSICGRGADVGPARLLLRTGEIVCPGHSAPPHSVNLTAEEVLAHSGLVESRGSEYGHSLPDRVYLSLLRKSRPLVEDTFGRALKSLDFLLEIVSENSN